MLPVHPGSITVSAAAASPDSHLSSFIAEMAVPSSATLCPIHRGLIAMNGTATNKKGTAEAMPFCYATAYKPDETKQQPSREPTSLQ
jgi:hypothetical protein